MIPEFVLGEKEQRLIELEYLFLMAGFSAVHISLLGTTRDVGNILGCISAQFSGNGRFTSARGFGGSRNGQTGSEEGTCFFLCRRGYSRRFACGIIELNFMKNTTNKMR